MGNWIRLVAPNQAIEILGVKVVGVSAEGGWKLGVCLSPCSLADELEEPGRSRVRRAYDAVLSLPGATASQERSCS